MDNTKQRLPLLLRSKGYEMTPTPEQLDIVNAAKTTKDNLIVHALAGAAKTTTLVLIAKTLSSTPILCLAFNTRIKEEMFSRLPGNCTTLTLNSLGHRTWAEAIGKRITINTSKTYEIVKGVIEALDGADKMDAYDEMANIIRAVDQGKMQGYVPDGHFPTSRPLLSDDELFESLDEVPTALMEHIIIRASLIGIERSLHGECDYNDQIYMPTVFHGSFRRFPLVLVDEAQDLSNLNHAMLKKLLALDPETGIAKSRLIAVGDENQSIYGFRGAHANSMALLRKTFDMDRLDLTVSFRCPIRVVEQARWRAPEMKYPEWAIEGEVHFVDKWGMALIPDFATVLCRNNAPLFSMAIKFLQNGRYPELVGSDIGKGLLKIMKKLGDADIGQDLALVAVEQWLDAKLEKSRDPGKLRDQAACMRVFLEQGKTLGEAIAYAEHLLSMNGNIKMMTGHKGKGQEWENVFILDRELIHLKKDQDKNLLYVMQTRSKEKLFYISSTDFIGA